MFKFRPDSPQCGCSFASPSFKGTELSSPTNPHTIFQMSGVVRIFFPSSLAPPPHQYQRSHTFDLDPLGSSWITARNCETPVVYLGHPSPPITTHHHPTRMNCSSQSVQVAGEELTGLHTAVIFGATFLQFRLVQDISRITGHLQVMGSSKPALKIAMGNFRPTEPADGCNSSARWSQKASAKHWWIFADILLQIPQLAPSPNRLGRLHAEGHTALLIAASSGIHLRRMWWPGTQRWHGLTSAAWRNWQTNLNWQTAFFGYFLYGWIMSASGFSKVATSKLGLHFRGRQGSESKTTQPDWFSDVSQQKGLYLVHCWSKLLWFPDWSTSKHRPLKRFVLWTPREVSFQGITSHAVSSGQTIQRKPQDTTAWINLEEATS